MHQLPKLPYAYDALEPWIDAKTMEIHHGKHHQAYVDNLNKTLEGYAELQARSVEDLLRSIDSIPEAIRTPVRNHGGGHSNHSFFWLIMSSSAGGNGGGGPEGKLGEALQNEFGGLASFKEQFTNTAVKLFGSGWAWLVRDEDGKLMIAALPNQDSPLMSGWTPILGLDVWEHAYYLKYQNRRAEYVEAWWKIVNWRQVEENFSA